MGHLVVLDGLDGSGKSTQLARLNEYFFAQNREKSDFIVFICA